jgi:hypothetical protein
MGLFQHAATMSQESLTDKITEQSPNKRYGKVIKLTQMNQILGKGAYKVVYKAIDKEEGFEVAWNTCQVQ